MRSLGRPFINQHKTKTLTEVVPAAGEPATGLVQGSQGLPPLKVLNIIRWEARLALLFGTLGLVVALHLPQRFWQVLAAWFGGRMNNPLDAATPFDSLVSPFVVFPLLALALWLQGAMTLVWLNNRAAPAETRPLAQATLPAPVKKTGRTAYLLPALTVLLLIGALLVGLGARTGQLLPDSQDRLPASNYDEMVYFSGSSLLAQGHLPYRDYFLAHPPVPELIYGSLLKLAGLAQGGFQGFLVARWGAIGLGLLTILTLFWVGGRMWSGAGSSRDKGSFALVPGLAAAWLYALDARSAGIATLETPANFFTALGLGCYLEAGRAGFKKLQNGLMAGSGVLMALAVLSKLPAVAFVVALAVYLVFRREWRNLAWHLAGLAGGAVVAFGPFLLLGGVGEVLRQVVFFQLLRPDETRAGKDQIGRLADYPDNALTIFMGGLALVFLAAWLVLGGRGKGRWLIPALASFPLIAIFTLSKSFHPWYYVQWSLPLALLAAGLFSSRHWQEGFAGLNRVFPAKNWDAHLRGHSKTLKLAGVVLLAGFLTWPLVLAEWQQSQRPVFDRTYRAVGAALNSPGPVLVFDPGYNFMAGQNPARLPFSGKYMVDSAGYMVYLNLDLDRQALPALLGRGLGLGGGQVPQDTAALFRQERAQALVVEGLIDAQWAVLDGVLALPQLTPRSVEFIGSAARKAATIDYADLYRVRPLPLRRAWAFDNGLVLTPYGLSTSLNGQANADPVEAGEVIRLTQAEAASRSLDLRFTWRVTRPQTAPVKMFIHVVNEAGAVVAQRDLEPQEGKADTSKWQSGDAFQDVHGLPLPAGLLPGRYRVEIGIYNVGDGVRITAEGQAGLVLGYLVLS